MHFSTLSFVEKICIDDLLEQHAKMLREGWKTIDVTNAFVLPRLRICKVSPLSALNTFNLVPFIDAVAMRVPSGFTVM
jgi:hypothetical protein